MLASLKELKCMKIIFILIGALIIFTFSFSSTIDSSGNFKIDSVLQYHSDEASLWNNYEGFSLDTNYYNNGKILFIACNEISLDTMRNYKMIVDSIKKYSKNNNIRKIYRVVSYPVITRYKPSLICDFIKNNQIDIACEYCFAIINYDISKDCIFFVSNNRVVTLKKDSLSSIFSIFNINNSESKGAQLLLNYYNPVNYLSIRITEWDTFGNINLYYLRNFWNLPKDDSVSSYFKDIQPFVKFLKDLNVNGIFINAFNADMYEQNKIQYK